MTQIRAKRVREFFGFLAKGTGAANGATLQAALAYVDATLNGALEDHGDETSRIFHFVNRFDIADYLANASITTQQVYGMTYVENIFVTNLVPKGTVYATPVENIRIFGTDFAELDKAGLSYVTSANGLIGVAHEPAYKNASAQTHAASGMMLFAEIKDYIIVGTIGDAAAPAALAGDTPVETPVPESVDENSKMPELIAYAEAHGISLDGCKSNADRLAAIRAAEAGE